MPAGVTALQRMRTTIVLQDQFSNKLRPVFRATDALRRRFGALNERMRRSSEQIAHGMFSIQAPAAGLRHALLPYVEHRRALAELSTLDLGEDALGALNKTAQRVAMRFGMDATSIVRSAYDIQSAFAGIQPAQLAKLTEVSVVLAKGTGASAEVITDYLGTMRGVFGADARRLGMGAWAERLAGMTAASVKMFKTEGPKISEFFGRLGASGTLAGISMAEQFAVAGQLMATMGGGEAATKFDAFIAQVGSAQAKLGLSFTNAQGRMLPVADILDKLRGKFGSVIDVQEKLQLKRAFGSDEAMKFIGLLLHGTGDLRENLAALERIEGMGPALKMAEKATTPFDRLNSSMNVLQLTISDAMGPSLDALTNRLNRLAAWAKSLGERFPHLARLMGMLALGVMLLGGAIGVLAITLGVLKITFATVAAMLTLFNAALWASPITWVVAGVLALVAAVAAVIFWWDALKARFFALSEWFASLPGWVQVLIAAFAPFITLPLLIAKHWEALKAVFLGVLQFMKPLLAFYMDTFIHPIFAAISKLTRLLTGPLSKIWGAISRTLNLDGLQTALMGTPSASLAEQARRMDPLPGALGQAVHNVASADKRKQVNITQHIRTDNFDPAAFVRGQFALSHL